MTNLSCSKMFPQPPRRVARKAAFAAGANARVLRQKRAGCKPRPRPFTRMSPRERISRRHRVADVTLRVRAAAIVLAQRAPRGIVVPIRLFKQPNFSNSRGDIAPRSRGAWRPSDAAGMSLLNNERAQGRPGIC